VDLLRRFARAGLWILDPVENGAYARIDLGPRVVTVGPTSYGPVFPLYEIDQDRMLASQAVFRQFDQRCVARTPWIHGEFQVFPAGRIVLEKRHLEFGESGREFLLRPHVFGFAQLVPRTTLRA